MQLDVATGGELHVALAAGVPAERLVLHGNNKSVDELRTALDGRASAASSSTASTSSTGSTRCTPPTACRARRSCCGSRPGVEAHTHEYVATGQDDSKFGFGLADGRRRAGRRAGARVSRPSSSSGCTCHIG